MCSDEEGAEMFEVEVLDDYAGQIVHIAVGPHVYHVDMSSDQCHGRCIETGDQAEANSRHHVLDKMSVLLLARHTGVRGVTA